MKTTIIPFDLETAKKIQAGEIKGKIRNKRGDLVRLICTDLKGAKRPIVGAADFGDEECVSYYTITGKCTVGSGDGKWNLILEVPDEVPDNEPQFKPFDKVLVRGNDASLWKAGFYSHELDGKHCVCGDYYLLCIPYEGNQELVGTTYKPKED